MNFNLAAMDAETQERKNATQPLQELSTELAEEMGQAPEQRLEWLLGQDPSSFNDLLLRINANARAIPVEGHNFDGEGVQAGSIGGSVPPDQEDKLAIVGDLLANSQQYIRQRLAENEDPKTVISELAMAIPVVINKVHLFGNGNGRTSRFLRMMLRDADQLTPEKVEHVVSGEGFERYDTTPANPVELPVMLAVKDRDGTADIGVNYDLFDADDRQPVEGELDELASRYPSLDSSIVGSYEDSFNFYESLRLLAKAKEIEGDVSVRAIVDEMAKSPQTQQDFKDAYRVVRKQRVEVLMQALLGQIDVPLLDDKKADYVTSWTRWGREHQGLPPLDPDSIRTVQEFQMATMEAFSPLRS